MTVQQVTHKLVGRTFVAVAPQVKRERFEPSQTFYSLFERRGKKWHRISSHAFPLLACGRMFGSFVMDDSKRYSIRPADVELPSVNMRYGK